MDNNNKPVKTPQGAPSKWGNLLYIIVPVLLIAVIASFMGTQNKKDAPKYFEIVEQFRSAQVTEYTPCRGRRGRNRREVRLQRKRSGNGRKRAA